MGIRRRTDPDAGRRALLQCLACALLLPRPSRAQGAAVAKARARGATRVDVRACGARGDGRHDDTDAFRAAIAALPPAGGTVRVPAGDYLLDPVRGVRLRSRMHLRMDPGARLLARPNAAARAYVLEARDVHDVEISGGQIVGERDGHLGTTGEWGHGLMIRGATAVTVRDLHVARCWGDGLSIGGSKAADGRPTPSRDIVVTRVRSIGNRRQGLTIGRSRHVRVSDCEFADTGGTLPGCGIDVEPDPGDVARDIVIARCAIRGNRGAGIQLYRRSFAVTVRDCVIEANRGHGVLAIGAEDCRIVGNAIRRNALGGIALRPGARGITVSLNEFAGNGRVGAARAWRRQIAVSGRARQVRIADDNRVVD
ncbi:hypothetical protein GCM10027084_07180 [Pseudoxanthomonas sangjuensis]|uniref:right-handed parallel beta-helix repeat-containing protein n=1 Tax=Pseudoxanthomonas sangjuensis TaxID=1503750 RepID=UPI0013909474|nr:right-handed parallel beta-helix repeat-containing protein [Pseudoxanthomonas sangjuensis]